MIFSNFQPQTICLLSKYQNPKTIIAQNSTKEIGPLIIIDVDMFCLSNFVLCFFLQFSDKLERELQKNIRRISEDQNNKYFLKSDFFVSEKFQN